MHTSSAETYKKYGGKEEDVFNKAPLLSRVGIQTATRSSRERSLSPKLNVVSGVDNGAALASW